MKLAAGVDVSRRARIGRDQFAGQIQLFNQVEELVRAAQAVRPALDQKAFDFAALNHASHTVAAFDEQQIAAHLLQTMSRDQAGNACANDDRINIHLVCSGTPVQYRARRGRERPPLRARYCTGLSRGASPEQSIPINPPGKLHYDKERENAKNCDRKPREAFEEERVREQDQIDELQDARFDEREAIANGQPQVRYDQRDRDQRADQERDVDRDVVDQISQQQVKAEERRADEEVVHRVQLDPFHGRQHENHEEEQEERDRRGESDLADPRTRIEFARHDHPDFYARKQVVVLPLQLPTWTLRRLLCGREAALRKIYLVEICPHREREVFDLAHLGAEVVPPFVHSLRFVSDFNDLRLSRREPDLVVEGAGVEWQILYLLPADDESEIVVNATLIRR